MEGECSKYRLPGGRAVVGQGPAAPARRRDARVTGSGRSVLGS